jgi:3'-5' exoribonuclease
MNPSSDRAHDLKALPVGTLRPFAGVYVLRRLSAKTARTGTAFLHVEVGDASGSFAFNVFGDTAPFAVLQDLAAGAIVRIEGQTDYYQDKLSPRITRVALIDPLSAESQGLMPLLTEASLEDPQALWEELLGCVDTLVHPELRATVFQVLADVESTFRISAAAISMHHAYRYGLLEHTVHMARVARAILPLYPQVNPDLAMAGIIVHDVGKTLEYDTQLTVKKTRAGVLQGHVILGYRLVRKAGLQCRLDPAWLERLEHIVLSHQGELEWGAAAMAATPEAVFVSMVDNLDAKLGVVQYALRYALPEREFGDYSPSLKTAVLTSPLPDMPLD